MYFEGLFSILGSLVALLTVNLLELLDDRHQLRSTIITSQLPIASWHEMIGDNTLADAILDRIVHNAYKINLIGGSMRKKAALICQTEER